MKFARCIKKKFGMRDPLGGNITDGFNGTEVKAVPVPKKDDAKEDKENGRNMLPTTPTTTVVSTLPTSFKERCKAFSVRQCHGQLVVSILFYNMLVTTRCVRLYCEESKINL